MNTNPKDKEIPPLSLTLNVLITPMLGKMSVEELERYNNTVSKEHNLSATVDVVEAETIGFLGSYAASRGFRPVRKELSSAFIVFSLEHVELGDMGKLTLRKGLNAKARLKMTPPLPPSDADALAHILKYTRGLTSAEQSVLTDWLMQIEKQREAGDLLVIIDNAHWFENLTPQERKENISAVQQRRDSASYELHEERKHRLWKLVQKYFEYLSADGITTDVPPSPPTEPENTPAAPIPPMSYKTKRGKSSKYSQSRRDKAVLDWLKLDTRVSGMTKEDFLLKEFGENEHTHEPKVAVRTFDDWQKDCRKRNPQIKPAD